MKITTISKPQKTNKDFVNLIESGDFFKEMDFAIQNSPTASMAVLMFKKYCTLQNLKPEYEDLWNKIIHEKAHYGFFTLWCKYNVDLQLQDIFYRKSKNYQVKKQDDTGKSSTFFNTITQKIIPTFDNDKSILKSQVAKSGGFEKFSGQIFQYNSTANEYEITPFFSVLNWMKTEFDTPQHISSIADNALFGNNLFIMRKSADTSVNENGDKITTNTDRVIGTLRKGKGVDNSAQNHFIEVDSDLDLTKLLHKIEIGNNIDIDKFNAVDDKAGKKICAAFYCFPQILANPGEGLFGNSGDAYNTAINFWKETCEFEAEKIRKAIADLGIELQTSVEVTPEIIVENKTADAQAELRGTVGFANLVLQVQISVANGITTRESAIAMFELISGFSNEEATKLLGNPKEIIAPPLTPPAI